MSIGLLVLVVLVVVVMAVVVLVCASRTHNNLHSHTRTDTLYRAAPAALRLKVAFRRWVSYSWTKTIVN